MRHLKALLAAFLDRRTPLFAKCVVVAAIVYGISPIDLIPDIIPITGEIDDVTIIIIALTIFLRMTKQIRKETARDS